MDERTDGDTPSQDKRKRYTPEVTERVGHNIRLARLGLNLTQRELGALVDEWTGVNEVSRWERGEHRPLRKTLQRLAEVLDVGSADWFFESHPELEEAA